MPPKHRHHNGKTAVQELFSKYVVDIRDQVIYEHGKSFMTAKETGNKWRDQIDYSKRVEQFLIDKTKVFIRLLDKNVSNYTNPQFLEAFVDEVADYLSKYTMRGSGLVRNQERKALKRILWDNNTYIQGMIAYQQQQRKKPRTPQTVREKHKRKHQEEAERNRQITIQVRLEFVATKNLRQR